MVDQAPETSGTPSCEPDLKTEWQFELDDLGLAERWLSGRSHDAEPSVATDEPLAVTDAYYDTADWRVFRAGFSLMLRRAKVSGTTGKRSVEVTLKSRLDSENGPARPVELSAARDEPSSSGSGDAFPPTILSPEWWPSGPVGSRLHRLCGRWPLLALNFLESRQEAYRVEYRDGVRGRLVLDRMDIRSTDGTKNARVNRVELQVPESGAARFEAFLAEMRGGMPLRTVSGTRLELALSALGREPAGIPELGPTRLDPATPVQEAARAILRTQLHAMLRHEPGTRLGDDQEELHAMRVATRRMRAAFRLFRDHLPANVVERADRELRRLGARLGAVRDLDLQIERLEEWRRELVSVNADALSPVIVLMSAERERHRRDLLRVLDSQHYATTVAFLVDFLRRPSPTRRRRTPRSRVQAANGRIPAGEGPQDTIALAVAELVEGSYKKVRKQMRRVLESPRETRDPSLDDLHRLRIRCKRLRYALEFLEDVIGSETGPMIQAAVAIQDTLGLIQDGRIGIARVREIAGVREVRARRETTMALGEIARRYREQMEAAMGKTPKLLRKLHGKRWKRLRRELPEQ